MDYSILVNKDNPLSKAYIPKDLVIVDSKYKNEIYLNQEAKEMFDKLKKEAEANNYFIDIESGYRSYNYQLKIYNKLLKEKGFNYAFRHIASPGESEHQTGLAIDFCIYEGEKCYIEHDIEDLPATKWIHQNASKYGFILRYPDGKEDITKYNYEPWHLRYVGGAADYIYKNNLTLEEYKEKHHNKAI